MSIMHNCRRIVISRDESDRSPKKEGTLTLFMPNGPKMLQTSTESSISDITSFTVDDIFWGDLFLSPKGFFILG